MACDMFSSNPKELVGTTLVRQSQIVQSVIDCSGTVVPY